MTNEEDQTAGKTHMSWSWLRMALNLREKIKLGDKQVIFIWAALVRRPGRPDRPLFEMGVELVQDLLTGRHGYRQIQAFQKWLPRTGPGVFSFLRRVACWPA